MSDAVYPAPFTEDVRIDPLLGNALAFQAGVLILLLIAAACSVSTRATHVPLLVIYLGDF